jgi:hypothetical protein
LRLTRPQGDMAAAALDAFAASFVQTVCGLKVPPAFPWHRRHARHCLPALLRVLSWVPWASVPHASGQGQLPRPAVLCVATTAFVRPGRFACRSLPVPWVDALRFVSLPARAGVGSSAVCVSQQTPGCWLRRSPSLRRLPPRRREALPSSRVTLLLTCPALRPRWCPARLPVRAQDCCLPVHSNCRLWVQLPGPILLSTIIPFSEFNDAACVLTLPLLRTPCFQDRPSVRLPTGWLVVGRVGLDSQPISPTG